MKCYRCNGETPMAKLEKSKYAADPQPSGKSVYVWQCLECGFECEDEEPDKPLTTLPKKPK